jgi:hypothetical protein
VEALGPHGERTGSAEGSLRKMGRKPASEIQKRASGFRKLASGFNASSWARSAFLNTKASFLPSFLSKLALSELPRPERGGGTSSNTGFDSTIFINRCKKLNYNHSIKKFCRKNTYISP